MDFHLIGGFRESFMILEKIELLGLFWTCVLVFSACFFSSAGLGLVCDATGRLFFCGWGLLWGFCVLGAKNCLTYIFFAGLAFSDRLLRDWVWLPLLQLGENVLSVDSGCMRYSPKVGIVGWRVEVESICVWEAHCIYYRL